MPAIARRPRPWQVVTMTLTARIVALMLAAQLALAGAAAAVLVANAQRAVAAEVAASVHAARNLVVATLLPQPIDPNKPARKPVPGMRDEGGLR